MRTVIRGAWVVGFADKTHTLFRNGVVVYGDNRIVLVGKRDPVPVLAQVMDFLGQSPPAQLRCAPLAEFWRSALAHWNAMHIPRQRSLLTP